MQVYILGVGDDDILVDGEGDGVGDLYAILQSSLLHHQQLDLCRYVPCCLIIGNLNNLLSILC